MTTESDIDVQPKRPSIVRDAKRLFKWSSVLGMILGLVCHCVPPEYQTACHAIISACNSGG